MKLFSFCYFIFKIRLCIHKTTNLKLQGHVLISYLIMVKESKVHPKYIKKYDLFHLNMRPNKEKQSYLGFLTI